MSGVEGKKKVQVSTSKHFEGFSEEATPAVVVMQGGGQSSGGSDPQTEKITDAIKEITCDPDLWEAMSTSLGLKGGEVSAQLLSIPQSVLDGTFTSLRVKRGEEAATAATPIEQGAAHLLIQTLRDRYGPPVAATSAPPPPMVVSLAPDDHKRLQFSDWLAQGVTGSFLPLPAEQLLRARQLHFDITGCDPDPP